MKVFKKIELKNFGKKYSGKVRDVYVKDHERILIATDRISAFDVILGFIPHKGHVLTTLAAFWFEKTKDIVDNHLIAVPDPNVMVGKNAKLIPIEMVVRGYISGVTGTSIWGSYQKGERTIYGIKFPDGLAKNQKLQTPVITPTTKAEQGHDERLTKKEILQKKIASKEVYEQMERAALGLFERGSKICEKAGIILVDTKYEFALLDDKLLLIDEIHTPDSSRFWIKKTYKERFEKGLEPENFDKEFVRLWYKQKGYTGDGKPPKMTQDLIKKVARRYIKIYELITGKKFIKQQYPIEKRIKKNLRNYFKPRIAVLISNKGAGTNLQAIIDGVEQKKINAALALVVSDEENAQGLKRAKKHKIPTVVNKNKNDLVKLLKEHQIDYVALTGWKQFMTDEFLDVFSNRILNLHPGLIPDTINGVVKNPNGTKGLWNKAKFTDKALQNFFDQKATYAGSSIHFLTKEFDFGPVLGRVFEKIRKNDTIESLYERLKKKENKLFVDVLKKLCK